ncbi:MAG: hypothetical protein RLZZ84_51 [Pseudomonadota bacterium]|jgi:hypothetical protein
MSALTRRDALKAGAIASAALAAPVGAAALRRRTVVLFDSRLPESLAFANTASGVQIDLAGEHATRFATLRAGPPQGIRIEGLTRWSDFAPLRRELERQGWRITAESRTGKAGTLFRWSMAHRNSARG